MSNLKIRRVLVIGLVALAIVLCLFGGSSAVRSWDVFGPFLREIEGVFHDAGTQWMVLLCVAIYCATFLLLRAPGKASSFYAEAPHPQRLERGASLRLSGHAEQCSSLRLGALIGFLGLGVLAYTLDYFTASKSTQALMLLGTAALGLGAGVWSSWPTGKFRGSWMVPATFVCLLVVASLWQSETARAYEYRGNSRWTGPWDNPNTFGSLMGTGLILALALGVGGLRMESRGWKRIVVSSSSLVAAFFLGRGLFNSYSRGAWLATACGGAYLLWHCISREMRGTRESQQPGSASASGRSGN